MIRIRACLVFGLLTALCYCTSINSIASATTLSANTFLRKTGISAELQGASLFQADSETLVSQLRSQGHLTITDFPAGEGNEQVTLDLKPFHSSLDATTECWASSPNGDVRIVAPNLTIYRGKVLGEPHSRVVLAVMDGSILCSILRESGKLFVLGPHKTGNVRGEHVLTEEQQLLSSAPFKPFNCLNDGILQPEFPTPIEDIIQQYKQGSGGIKEQSVQVDHSTLLQTDIAVEADSIFFAACGGKLNLALGYIGAMFSMSSMIYEDEANLTHHLSWVKVWTTKDPYNVDGNAYALPDTVRKYWNLHYANVPRDLAHVLTSVGYGGGGYGYFSLCDTNYSYSVSSPQTGHQYPTFAFTYDVYIISHEIGHNFSLPHSHTCYWNPPLDTCFTRDDAKLNLSDACDSLPVTPRRSPGTIMSYCANANYVLSGNDFSQFKLEMTFSKRVDTVLRANAERTPCITPPSTPTVILLSPRGSESFRSDTTVTVAWTTANVQNISLEYSSNAGASWNLVTSGIPATKGSYHWKLPNISSKQMLVRVVDDSDHSVADTSLLFFTIAASLVEHSGIEQPLHYAISPNPSHEAITLRTSRPTRERVRLEIVDESGKVVSVMTREIDNEVGLELNHLVSGSYFLRVTSLSAGDSSYHEVIPFEHVQ